MSKVKPLTPTQANVLAYAAGVDGAKPLSTYPTRSIRLLYRTGYLPCELLHTGITLEGLLALADFYRENP